MQTPPEEKAPSVFWLRLHDQRTIAVLAIGVIIAMALAWLVLGGATGGLVEVDRQPRREAPFRVDLNSAAWPELSQLPGIGETLARRIVESREKEGPFPSPDALLARVGRGAEEVRADQALSAADRTCGEDASVRRPREALSRGSPGLAGMIYSWFRFSLPSAVQPPLK